MGENSILIDITESQIMSAKLGQLALQSSSLHLISYRSDQNKKFIEKNFSNSFEIYPNYEDEAKVYSSFLTFLDLKVAFLYDQVEDKFIKPFQYKIL